MENKINTLQGIEQGRAKYAYDCAIEGNGIAKNTEYKAYTKKIPMMIKTNGLGATLAFIKSKQSEEKNKAGYAYKLIYEQIKKWLIQDPKNLISIKDNDELADKIITLNSPDYRAVTNEILALFNWLKRFAEGLIEEKKPEKKGDKQ